MRFTRFGQYEFQDTNRKRAAVLRRNRLECERHPLFADEIAATQDTPDQAMDSRREIWTRRQAESRLVRARHWREARAQLRVYDADDRLGLLAYWQRCSWPADPEYLVSMLQMYEVGRLSLGGDLIHDYGPGAWRASAGAAHAPSAAASLTSTI